MFIGLVHLNDPIRLILVRLREYMGYAVSARELSF